MVRLLSLREPFVSGRIVDRPNRFVIRVRFTDDVARAHLADPGALEGIVEPGMEILCRHAPAPDRTTDYDALAVRVEDMYVSLRASLANELFARAIEAAALPKFANYRIDRREPALPDHGRTDFLLVSDSSDPCYVEVKSCTHVDGEEAKFPDRQTERGRRHLRSLESLVENGHRAALVFVVQRPDATRVRPYRSVDPEFATLLARVERAGVTVTACTTAFEPPIYRLDRPTVPVVPAEDG